MKKHKIVALAMAMAVAASAVPTAVFAQQQQSTSLAGTAKDEAKKPYTDYSVRARDVQAGSIASTMALDAQGNFSLTGLSTQRYLVELVNKDGKVVCTEGPFNLAQTAIKSDVVIDCGKVPAAWWLVGAAAAAGITAGVVAGGDASAAR
jgi:hypothetical protein